MLLLATKQPAVLLWIVPWLFRGVAFLKRQLAERSPVDVATMPLRDSVLHLMRTARADKRAVVLATATNERAAKQFANHLGIVDDVLASTATSNLKSGAKARALVDRFGEYGFDYVGDSVHDLPVFRSSRRAYLVARAGCRLHRRSLTAAKSLVLLDESTARMAAWLRAIRVHQWLKNVLLFVPLLAAHRVADSNALLATAAAFLAFCACASSAYIVNDLLDLAADRLHRTKKFRPFASGELPIAHGATASALLLVAGVAIALQLPPAFGALLGLYYAITTLYSVWLKRHVVIDVTILAGLYTLRILAGCAAASIRPSFWLLALSMFVFLSLAMLKRYSELVSTRHTGLRGRGYLHADAAVVLALGCCSGLIGVLVLALYVNADSTASSYATPEYLWMLPVLALYWMCRAWFKAHRGEIDDDPVVFAARDPQSICFAAVGGLFMALAAFGGTPM